MTLYLKMRDDYVQAKELAVIKLRDDVALMEGARVVLGQAGVTVYPYGRNDCSIDSTAIAQAVQLGLVRRHGNVLHLTDDGERFLRGS